jgi:hypothetical protein
VTAVSVAVVAVTTWRSAAAPVQADTATAVCARAGRTLTEAEWRAYLPDLPYQEVCPD